MTDDEIIAALREGFARADADLIDAVRRRTRYETALAAFDDDQPELAAPSEVVGRTLSDVTLHAVTVTVGTPADGVHPIDRVAPVTAPDPATAWVAEREDERRAEAKAAHPSAPSDPPRQRPPVPPAGSIDYVAVATVSRQARRAGGNAAQAVARHFDITVRAAQQRIDKARRDGLDVGPSPRRDAAPAPTRLAPVRSGLGPIERAPFNPDATRDAAGPPPTGPIAPLSTKPKPAPTDGRPTNPTVGTVWTPERALAILDAGDGPDDAA